jgi:hypothetical protein
LLPHTTRRRRLRLCIVVLPASLADAWQGAGERYGQEGAPEDDYTRACAASDEASVGLVKVGAGVGVVLPLQSASIATIVDPKLGETRVFLLMGDVQLEMAMKERGAWKKTKRTFRLDDDAGVVLLDATMTTARASADQKRAEPLACGTWSIEELEAEAGARACTRCDWCGAACRRRRRRARDEMG